MLHRDFLQGFAHVLLVLLSVAGLIGFSNFAVSISGLPRGLHARRTARIESANWTGKKICWMKKNPARNGLVIAPIEQHRANHPNQLVIRESISEPEFCF